MSTVGMLTLLQPKILRTPPDALRAPPGRSPDAPGSESIVSVIKTIGFESIWRSRPESAPRALPGGQDDVSMRKASTSVSAGRGYFSGAPHPLVAMPPRSVAPVCQS